MSNLFYAPPAAWPENGGVIRLDGGEARHMRVLRLAPGDAIRVMDGAGRIAACALLELGRGEAKARIEGIESFPQPKARPVIALALSKAVRRGFFMEKAVELGCFGLWLWQGRNSQGKISPALAENLRGQLVAGAKQCANPWLPQVETFADINALVARSAQASLRIFPHERQEGQPVIGRALLGQPGVTVFAIGPEGGYDPQEARALLEGGFLPVSLGDRVLRCETAAVLCLGLHYWAALDPRQ